MIAESIIDDFMIIEDANRVGACHTVQLKAKDPVLILQEGGVAGRYERRIIERSNPVSPGSAIQYLPRRHERIIEFETVLRLCGRLLRGQQNHERDKPAQVAYGGNRTGHTLYDSESGGRFLQFSPGNDALDQWLDS